MKKTRIVLTIVTTLAAFFITCSIAFGGNAVVDSKTYTHPSQFDNCIVIDGVDVSYWQNSRGSIDWDKVKRQGIDYALIRIGYTSLDSFSMNRDSYFEENYQGAKDAGLMVGAYYYSCATTMKEAQKEADYVLNILDGRDLDLPVVYDFEYAGRIKTKYKSRAQSTSNALAFLNKITKGGYEAMFYSYRNIMDPSFNPSGYKINMNLIEDKYKVWIAQYYTDISYSRPFEFWQYTSSGSVAGLPGSIDCNFWYYDNDAEVTKSGTTSIKEADVSLGKTTYDFTKFKKEPAVTVRHNGSTLVEGTDYKLHYIQNVFAGTAYAMVEGIGEYSNTALAPFTINKRSMSDVTVSNITSKFYYIGKEWKPTIKVSYSGTTLKKGVDYTVSYSNNKNVGTGTVKVTGKGNYSGTVTRTFKISKATPTLSGTSTYSKTTGGQPFKLDTKSNGELPLKYSSNNTSVATIDSSGLVTLTGKEGTATITVTSPAGDNYNAATKKVVINVKKSISTPKITTGGASYTKTTENKYFLLYAKTTGDGELTYSSSDTSIATVTETGRVNLTGETGTASITIKSAATNNYKEASKTVKLTVTTPSGLNRFISGVKNTKAKIYSSAGAGYIKISWKKTAGYFVDGFEVYRSTKKTTGFKKVSTFTKQTSKKYTTGMKKGKKYYYKVRAYRTIAGKKYYTKWSTTIGRIFK